MSEERKTQIIKIASYLGVFILLVIIIRFSDFSSNNINNNKETETPNNTVENKIKEINDLYYTMNVQLILDDDAITLQYQKINNVEIGLKKYHKITTEYTKVDNNYYKLENDTFVHLDNFVDFEYDKTFLNITNLKKILDLGENTITNYESDKKKLTKTIFLNDIVKVYNECNNEQVIIYEDGTVLINIIYDDEKIDYIELNMTDFYNNLNKTNYDNIIYKMTITGNKEEDASWILEKIN